MLVLSVGYSRFVLVLSGFYLNLSVADAQTLACCPRPMSITCFIHSIVFIWRNRDAEERALSLTEDRPLVQFSTATCR